MSPTAGAPVLVAFTGGRFSREVQGSWSDSDLVSGALSVLEESYGREIPAPLATAVTHWTTDPFALGSYSYLPVGASRADVNTMAEPVGKRLLFAGEATWWPHYQTAHGALLSGLREAQRLGVQRFETPGLSGSGHL